MIRPSSALAAILLMVASMACFSTMNVVIRLLSDSMASTQMVFLRNLFSLALIVFWACLMQRRHPRFPTMRLKSHFWRATFGVAAMELWFYAITIMPLTLATALSFTTPIFATIFAIVFLREHAGLRRWGAIIAGFAGMLIILRPGSSDVDWQAVIVLFSSGMMAIASVLVKTLTRTEPPETIVFYMALFMVPWSALPVIGHWQDVTTPQLLLVLLIALFSTSAHLLLTRAYMRADMVVLMPFDFTRLIFTALMAHALFGEMLDMPTIAGSLIIVASTVYIAHREARFGKRKEPASQL